MIIRNEKGVSAKVLSNIYKTLGQVIKEESCYYTKAELEELKEKDYILLGGLKDNG